MQPTDVDYDRLRRLLSAERLNSYMRACRGDQDAAFSLYEWNIEASAAAVSLAAMVEVVLRNALDRRMVEWAATRGDGDWLSHAPLDKRGQSDVRMARERAGRAGREVTHGHVIAELNLGFWRYLVSRRYLTTLWIPSLAGAFPGVPGKAHLSQRHVEGDVQQLLFLRNRAAHHEPIHRRDLQSDLRRSVGLAAAIDPVAGRWVARQETLSDVVARKPHA